MHRSLSLIADLEYPTLLSREILRAAKLLKKFESQDDLESFLSSLEAQESSDWEALRLTRKVLSLTDYPLPLVDDQILKASERMIKDLTYLSTESTYHLALSTARSVIESFGKTPKNLRILDGLISTQLSSMKIPPIFLFTKTCSERAEALEIFSRNFQVLAVARILRLQPLPAELPAALDDFTANIEEEISRNFHHWAELVESLSFARKSTQSDDINRAIQNLEKCMQKKFPGAIENSNMDGGSFAIFVGFLLKGGMKEKKWEKKVLETMEKFPGELSASVLVRNVLPWMASWSSEPRKSIFANYWKFQSVTPKAFISTLSPRCLLALQLSLLESGVGKNEVFDSASKRFLEICSYPQTLSHELLFRACMYPELNMYNFFEQKVSESGLTTLLSLLDGTTSPDEARLSAEGCIIREILRKDFCFVDLLPWAIGREGLVIGGVRINFLIRQGVADLLKSGDISINGLSKLRMGLTDNGTIGKYSPRTLLHEYLQERA